MLFIKKRKVILKPRMTVMRIKESSYLNYLDVINLYRSPMSQKLPVNDFKWVANTSQFNKDFIENYNKGSNEGYFLEVDLPSLTKKMKIEKVEKTCDQFPWSKKNIL